MLKMISSLPIKLVSDKKEVVKDLKARGRKPMKILSGSQPNR